MMRLPATVRLLLLLSSMLMGTAVAANYVDPLAPLETSSPSATFQSFLDEAREIENDYSSYLAHKTAAKAAALTHRADRLRRLMDLESFPPATKDKIGGAAIGFLIDILARLPAVPAGEIPGSAGRDWEKLPGKWSVPGSEISIVRVDQGPHAGEYLFSAETIRQLPKFHALIIGQPPLRPVAYENWHRTQVGLTGPIFPDHLLRALPASAHRTVLDTPLWKVVVTLLFGLGAVAISALWGLLVRRITRDARPVERLCGQLTPPLLLAALIYSADAFIKTEVNNSGAFATGEEIAAAILIYAAFARAAWVGCFLVVEAIIAAPHIPEDSYDAHLLRLAARLAAVVAAGGILLYGANQIGVPALGLLASVGIGGVAIALASQSTIENLFGGLSIFADRPFRVGDFIRYGGSGGSVEAIGPRSSRIRGLDGTLTTVPNGDLAKMHITNLSMRDKSLFQHVLGLRYETSPEQFEWLLTELRRVLAAHEMVENSSVSPRVALTGFGSSSINLEVRAHVLTSDSTAFLNIQGQLLLDVMRAVEKAGTGFAFPSHTAYLARDTGMDEIAKSRIEEEIRARRPAPDAPRDTGSDPCAPPRQGRSAV